MLNFERTDVWRKTLGTQGKNDEFSSERERLRVAFLSARERASSLTSRIQSDIPGLTVHDVTHLDALWDYVDILAGPSVPLNPLEGFVLGCAFLIHDAAMCVAAYPGGFKDIEQLSVFKDALANQKEDNEHDRRRNAAASTLRLLHAQKSSDLAIQAWSDPDEGEAHLLDDSELRIACGHIIGQVAKSHWDNIDRLHVELDRVIGAPPILPREWDCDLLKLACLLRACDAAQIDSRRAPYFSRILTRPTGTSADHWKFQSLLTRPILSGDRLLYTATRPFEKTERNAWWLCADTLKTIDKELRQTDALLADTRKNIRLLARGVTGVESARLLAESIPTARWAPIDANIKVSNLPALISHLGGEAIYGDNPYAVVRELIQNAADAVRARRVLEGRKANWGQVGVSLLEQDGHWRLVVADTGIGMSVDTITEGLLNFGTSYWSSDLARLELPTLAAARFQSVGKFGIGFFSAFMVARSVIVTTRRPRAAQDKAIRVSFEGGLGERPVVEIGDFTPEVMDAGTSVQILLSGRLASRITEEARVRPEYVLNKISELIPALDVDVEINVLGNTKIVSASSWKEIDAAEFVATLPIRDARDANTVSESDDRDFSSHVRFVVGRDGSVLGRGYLDPKPPLDGLPQGMLAVGGLASNTVDGIVGLFDGTASVAARDRAVLNASESYDEWLSQQVSLLVEAGLSDEEQHRVQSILVRFGCFSRQLKFAKTAHGWMNISDILHFWRTHRLIGYVEDRYTLLDRSVDTWNKNIELYDNVMIFANNVSASLSVSISNVFSNYLTSVGDLILKELRHADDRMNIDIGIMFWPSAEGEIGVSDGKVVTSRYTVFSDQAAERASEFLTEMSKAGRLPLPDFGPSLRVLP